MSSYNTDPFWDYLYQLRETGILCDIQLFVKNQQDEFVSIYAHKVILAASSYYFQSCLSQGELLDIYNFDGIHVDNLQIVLDYMYHQISWGELQSNAEATIAAKTLGIMEQTSRSDPFLDRSVLKDTEGNKVLLVKRFNTGRKPSSDGAGKISSMSKRVILPHDEIAKLIVNRRNIKPSTRDQVGKLVLEAIGSCNQSNNAGAEGVDNTVQVLEIPPEEGEIMNSEDTTQQAMFDGVPASDPNDLQLHSQDPQVNSVVVDQQGIVSLYTGTQEEVEMAAEEIDAGCRQPSEIPSVEDAKQACEQSCEQTCEQQLVALSSVNVKEHVLMDPGQESDGILERTPAGDNEGCSEASTGVTGSDVMTEHTGDVPAGASDGAGDEMSTAAVDDDRIRTLDDASGVFTNTAAVPSVDDKAETLQTISSDKDGEMDTQNQSLCGTDAMVVDNDDKTKMVEKLADGDVEKLPPPTDVDTPQKDDQTTAKVVTKHRGKAATSVVVADTPIRSRRIRRPPPDEIYEWSMPSLRRRASETTRGETNVGEESPHQSPRQESARQKRVRVVIKKEAESTPSSDDIAGTKLVMSLGDGEQTTTRARSKRKTVLQEEEEPIQDDDATEGVKKKPRITPDDEDSEETSLVKPVSTRPAKASRTPKSTPVIRRRGRPRIKKEEIKLELEATDESQADVTRRNMAISNVQMESNSGPCVCAWCGKVFKNNTGLSIHENWVHKGLGQREGSASHECGICKKTCKSFAALRNHEMQKHDVKREWPCETCGVVFTKGKELKKHRMREHNEQRYECEVCQATFISREGWKIHMYKQHTDAKPCHMCEMCGKVFKMKHELKIHCKMTHSNRRDFACQLCERSFKNNVTLTRHLLTYHSNVRNHHCDVCNRAFKTNMDMKKHRERHFRENAPLTKEGKRVRKHPDGLDYPCQFCGKIFYKRYLATAHENLQHRQKEQGMSYTCTVCDKVFPIKHYLMQHISNKHRPRRFKCVRCQREFAQQYELRKHQQQPGRCQGRPDFMKPYECEHCGRKFTLKGNLTKHMQATGRCKRVHQSQVIDYIVVVEEGGGVESTNQASAESLETAEALATLQTAQALQLLQNTDPLQTTSEIAGGQELQMLQGLGGGAEVMTQEGAGAGAGEEMGEVMEEEMGTMLHITDGEAGDGQVHILEIHPGEEGEQTQQIQISEELAAQLGGTQDNIIVQIVPAEGEEQEEGQGEGEGYEEAR